MNLHEIYFKTRTDQSMDESYNEAYISFNEITLTGLSANNSDWNDDLEKKKNHIQHFYNLNRLFLIVEDKSL